VVAMDRTGDFATPEPKRRRVEGMANAFSSRKSSPGLSRPPSASKQPNQHNQQSTLTPNSTLQDHIATPAKGEPVKIYQSAKMCQINDPIHGNISFEEVCRRIIDTKEFQRLRKLAQLGLCDRVYPGSTHSRFSHSLGVAHYAEAFLLYLIRHQPELNITPVDVLCVKISGLCHDLGHGPFSHVFDGVFMSRARPEKKWHHEEWSVSIFRHLLQQNHINLQDYGLSEIDQLFIEEIILGTKDADRKGRPHEKFYLYDIVNNTRSGLDVDKLDYFRRDIKHSHVQ
jgi:HD superfamily phosphohydrolase